MLRGADKRLFTSGQVQDVFGGRLGGFPDALPGHMDGPISPPVAAAIAWWDFSDLSTLTLSNTDITAVADKSGSGFNLSVSTGAPYLGRDPVSRRTVGVFSVNCSWAQTSVSASDLTSSAFVVGMTPTLVPVTANSAFTLLGPNADGGNEFRINGDGANAGRLATYRADTDQKGIQSNAVVTAGKPFVAGQVLTATDVTHYNGTTSETDASVTTFTAARTLVLGRAPSVAEADRHGFQGWMGEIIIYDSSLSGADALLVVGYLMNKWGVS